MDSLRAHPAWTLEARLSPLESSAGYSTALSSPTTPQPPQFPSNLTPTIGIPHLPPTQPLNINRRQARLVQLAGQTGEEQRERERDRDRDRYERESANRSLRDRDPMPPPTSSLPSIPRSNAPPTNIAVPPARPPRPPIGLGITAPSSASLLSPTSPPSSTSSPARGNSSTRPSSRRALTRALELAQDAVEYDRSSDAQRAVNAYGKSVALLGEVMARVARGETGTTRDAGEGRAGRRRSMVARDEEMRRLKAIHDTYADRMRILCILHSVAPSPSLPAHIVAMRSPTSPNFPPLSLSSSPSNEEGTTAIGSALVGLNEPEDDPITPDDDSSIRGAPAMLAPPRSTAQHPQLHAPSHARTHSRSLSHSASPSPAPTIRAPSAHANLPPPRPPPAVGLPPLPIEAAREAPKRSPPLQTLSRQQSMERSPTTPTPGQPASATSASPPRKITTRTARSSSLSARTGAPPPPVPPVPPLPPPQSTTAPAPPTEKVQDRSQDKTPVVPHPIPSPVLVSATTAQGTISQRRRGAPAVSPPMSAPSAPPSSEGSSTPPAPASAVMPTIKLPAPGSGSTTPTTGIPPRLPVRGRAVSQPGARPPAASGVPEVPALSRTGSSSGIPSLASTPLQQLASLPLPPAPTTLSIHSGNSPTLGSSMAVTPATPHPHGAVPLTPLPMPTDLALRPFTLMRALLLSILHAPGFHLTPRLFIPTALWSQGGAKLLSLPQKTSALLTLAAGLAELQHASDERERERRGGWGRDEEEEGWEKALGQWERVCEGVRESTRGKGGFVGLGVAGGDKKGNALGRLGRQLEKMTNGKNLDSPAAYVHALTKLFQAVPVLETHLKSLINPQSQSQSYAHLTPQQRAALEARLRRSAEFFGSFVVPFVVRDLGALMEKYLKKGEKWLEE